MSAAQQERLRWFTMLRSDVALERVEAIEKIPNLDVDEIVDSLLPLLADSNGLVRLCAAEALGKYRSAVARAALRQFLVNEQEESARAYGLSSLAMYGEREDILYLWKECEPASGAQLRIHSLAGMCIAARRYAIKQLMDLVEGSSDLRGAAVGALSAILSLDVPPSLVDALDEIRRSEQDPTILSEIDAIVSFVRNSEDGNM